MLYRLVAGAQGADDEFGGPGVDVALDDLADRIGVAQGAVFGEVDVGAMAGNELVALGHGFVPVWADVVAQQHPDVVVLDFPLVLVRRLKNYVAALADFPGGGAGDQPAVADPADPAGGGGTAAANPDRGRGFEAGFGRDGDVVAGEELALVGYVVLFPQSAHQTDGLVGAAAAVILGDSASLVLLDFLAAQTDGGEAAALGQEVQGGDLLGEDDGVAQGQGQDAGAELHPVGPGGNHG